MILVSIQGVWDVLFSTWGYNRALTLAVSAVLAGWALSSAKRGPAFNASADSSLPDPFSVAVVAKLQPKGVPTAQSRTGTRELGL